MSLDIYLESDEPARSKSGPRIFIRDGGSTREISREEWDQRFPGREPVTFESDDEETKTLYHANITHNLNKMAERAGFYKALWRPDENGIERARELIAPLLLGIERLRSDPEHYRTLNAENGWGTYDDFVPWLESLIAACTEHPEARVRVWR